MLPAQSPLPSTGNTGWDTGRLRKSCDACQEAKVRCSQQKPSCHRCTRHRQPCIYSIQRRQGRPRKRTEPAESGIPESSSRGLERPLSNEDGHEHDPIMFDAAVTTLVDTNGNNNHAQNINVLFPPSRIVTQQSPTRTGSRDSVITSAQAQPSAAPSTLLSPTDPFREIIFSQDYDFSSAFFLPQALDGSSTFLLPTSTGSADSSNAGASGSSSKCGAKCYAGLLNQLLYLSESIPEPMAVPSIDVILLAERELRTQQSRISTCNACGGNRSSLLLLATITERVVQLLDGILEKKAALDTENARISRHTWPRTPSYSPTHTTSRRRNACHLPLHVGSYEVDSETKNYFLKQLLQLRLKKLMTVLKELRQISMARPSDSVYRASELLLGESLRRLEYLRGQLQLWG